MKKKIILTCFCNLYKTPISEEQIIVELRGLWFKSSYSPKNYYLPIIAILTYIKFIKNLTSIVWIKDFYFRLYSGSKIFLTILNSPDLIT